MAFVVVFTTIILVLQISKQYMLTSAFQAVIVLIIVVLYFVSASKITARLPGAVGKQITTLARRVGGCLCGVIVSSLLYVAADAGISQTTSVQLSVMVKVTAFNLLQIMFHSLFHFFMAKFLIEAAKGLRVGPPGRNSKSDSKSDSKRKKAKDAKDSKDSKNQLLTAKGRNVNIELTRTDKGEIQVNNPMQNSSWVDKNEQ